MLSPRTQSQRRDTANHLGLRDDWHRAHLSATEEVVPLIETVAAAMNTHGYSDQDIFGLRLALEEALINAIKHGHQYDPGKQVSVRYRIRPEHVVVDVQDEGPGFDPTAVPDATAPENWERPSGRGVLLMRTYTSWLRYNRQGNGVRLCKYSSTLQSQD
jgi:serine/threonine-protein kinase RsbW